MSRQMRELVRIGKDRANGNNEDGDVEEKVQRRNMKTGARRTAVQVEVDIFAVVRLTRQQCCAIDWMADGPCSDVTNA